MLGQHAPDFRDTSPAFVVSGPEMLQTRRERSTARPGQRACRQKQAPASWVVSRLPISYMLEKPSCSVSASSAAGVKPPSPVQSPAPLLAYHQAAENTLIASSGGILALLTQHMSSVVCTIPHMLPHMSSQTTE